MFGNRIPSLFKTPKSKPFEFKPRYYNELKDRLEGQERRVLREMEYEKMMERNPELKLRDEMHQKWSANSRRQANSNANRRVIIIAGLLAILAYYFLYR